jgi:hypothetical protein
MKMPFRDGRHTSLCKSGYFRNTREYAHFQPSPQAIRRSLSAAVTRIDKALRTLENRRFSFHQWKAFP